VIESFRERFFAEGRTAQNMPSMRPSHRRQRPRATAARAASSLSGEPLARRLLALTIRIIFIASNDHLNTFVHGTTASVTTTLQQPAQLNTATMMNGNHHHHDNMNGDDWRPGGLSFLDPLRGQYSHQPVFLQAVDEMARSLQDDGVFDDPLDGEFNRRAFLAMTEPERTVSFKVPWVDDRGRLRYNRAWRVEFNRYESKFVSSTAY
jgi:hypothetical protein